ncbi:ATP-binding cassette domain-containing protein [Thalassotalea euphylliae]|uniref:ATP-binding cassette domain-containing protein n=1 Tax=Thalassotalea euphylliae TaxID=1655234 RepID=A0A3E0UEU0_9GAMM|nr:ATP-binding cassette domain-containing protein [Thalassotalea euphylliae]REL34332.1 ATP-binding cassette domain-containing protein [Thalassotalea euphylliae]
MFTIEKLSHPNLTIDHWQLSPNQHWCVLTQLGCGEQYLLDLFNGDLVGYQASNLTLPAQDKIAVLSFQALQNLYEVELKRDRSDELNKLDIGRRVRDFIPLSEPNLKLIELIGLSHKLGTGFRQLSTGESRKLMIIKAISDGAKLLICENPNDSLDKESRHKLALLFNQLMAQGIQVIYLVNNREDIPTDCQHFATMSHGQLEVLTDKLSQTTHTIDQQIDHYFASQREEINWPNQHLPLDNYQHPYIAKLVNCTVRYGDKPVFERFNLTIRPLQHTLIQGKNGCGKSTALQLISGDCPQCFANDVTVFGYRRGSGETIWDIKKHIGLVSSDLHRSYRVRCNVLTVVISGFFDSIGVYQAVSQQHIDDAKQWLAIIGLADHSQSLFHDLSHGQQRLVLIARALVKSPLMLLLDEPTQGLDETSRHMLLGFLEQLAAMKQTTILYVSHREDEHLPLFTQSISF